MTFIGWMALAGVLLLVMGLTPALLGRLPVATSLVYLGLGLAIGPAGLGWLHLEVVSATPWLERITEVAVIVSLFVGGLRLRLPLGAPEWRAAYLLAGPVMLATIVGVAAFAHFVLGLGAGAALLLGAVLAPTDPVLAAAVSVQDAADHDSLRYGISGEAGLNDGMAFPFVVFALLWAGNAGPGAWIGEWAAIRLAWAVAAGLIVGYAFGRATGQLAVIFRARGERTAAPGDFLALALIALSYAAAHAIDGWGFLAVFAAGIGLRHAEVAISRDNPSPPVPPAAGDDTEAAPAESLVTPAVEDGEPESPAVVSGLMVAEAITIGDTAERLMEVLLVVIVGVALAVHWDPRALAVALVLFVVIRPLATHLLLAASPTTLPQRWLMGWFGIRGIGSIYYLAYALSHGAVGSGAAAVVDLTVSVVALSIVLHGITIQPLLAWYERRLHSP